MLTDPKKVLEGLSVVIQVGSGLKEFRGVDGLASSMIFAVVSKAMVNRLPWDLVYQEWWGEYPPHDRTEYVGLYRDVAYRWHLVMLGHKSWPHFATASIFCISSP